MEKKKKPANKKPQQAIHQNQTKQPNHQKQKRWRSQLPHLKGIQHCLKLTYNVNSDEYNFAKIFGVLRWIGKFH